MVENKRKSADSVKRKANSQKKQKKNNKKVEAGRGGGDKRKRKGPRLPSSLWKELDHINHNDNGSLNDSDDEINSEQETGDLYEYEEALAEEESKKNRRYDPVENYEYELPEKFEDENILSDDDDDSEDGENKNDHIRRRSKGSKQLEGEDDVEDEDDERHLRMLQGIAGMPSEAFDDKKKNDNAVISDAYPESEFNPSQDILDGNGHITIEDLLEPLQGKPGCSKLTKRMHEVDKKTQSIQAPVPRVVRGKLERKAVYEQSKKDVTKWEPLVKRNREAPTIHFDEDTNLGFPIVGAIASRFEPKTEFKKKMASLVSDDKVMEAHKEDGSKLL